MGVFTYEMEVTSSVPPARMFKAFVLDNVVPKVVPQAVKSVDILEGDGGPGTIKQVNFGEGSQFKYVKERVDEVDKENFKYKYTIIEGDALMGTLEKITNEVTFEALPDGGTVCKSSSQYFAIGDTELKTEEIKAGKEKAMGIFKAVEGYLLANPDA